MTPTAPIAPGGESWSGFIVRASDAVRALARRHPGEMVVAAVHAGVIEATMISFLEVPREVYRRGWLHTTHASMTEWAWVPDRGPLGPAALQRRLRHPPGLTRARAAPARPTGP